MRCGYFRFLEHTADAYVEATGRTLEEAFEWMAKGMFEIMTDTSKVRPLIKKDLSGTGVDLEGVLYRWLEDLLILHDAEGLVFSEFRVYEVKKIGNEYTYKASVWGEVFDPSRHEVRTEVKAVTYSLMEVKNVDSCWVLRVVFDL